MMANQTATRTFLRLIGEHEGEWSWYQFERAFPPGWLADETPDTRAMDILKELERDGLVETSGGGPQPRYGLTEWGRTTLREAEIASTSR